MSVTDEQAIARYRYMLRTAPPEDVERAHEEAFANLTPEQRRMVLQGLSEDLGPNERPQSDDPRDLARAATRAEYRRPGFMESRFGGMNNFGPGYGGGPMGGGMMGGGMMGGVMGGLLTGIAGGFIGSSIANMFFNNPMHAQGFQQFANDGNLNDLGGADAAGGFDDSLIGNPVDPMGDPADADPLGDPAGDPGVDPSGDVGGDPGFDFGSADVGGYDSGFDSGGDFGGGDFGGSEF